MKEWHVLELRSARSGPQSTQSNVHVAMSGIISLHDLRSQDYKNIILASGSNGFPQSRGILAYTINTFGPSAGRVSRRLSVCLSVMSSVVHHEGRV